MPGKYYGQSRHLTAHMLADPGCSQSRLPGQVSSSSAGSSLGQMVPGFQVDAAALADSGFRHLLCASNLPLQRDPPIQQLREQCPYCPVRSPHPGVLLTVSAVLLCGEKGWVWEQQPRQGPASFELPSLFNSVKHLHDLVLHLLQLPLIQNQWPRLHQALPICLCPALISFTKRIYPLFNRIIISPLPCHVHAPPWGPRAHGEQSIGEAQKLVPGPGALRKRKEAGFASAGVKLSGGPRWRVPEHLQGQRTFPALLLWDWHWLTGEFMALVEEPAAVMSSVSAGSELGVMFSKGK